MLTVRLFCYKWIYKNLSLLLLKGIACLNNLFCPYNSNKIGLRSVKNAFYFHFVLRNKILPYFTYRVCFATLYISVGTSFWQACIQNLLRFLEFYLNFTLRILYRNGKSSLNSKQINRFIILALGAKKILFCIACYMP